LPLSKFPYSFVLQTNNHKILYCLGIFRSLSRVSYERIFIFLIFFSPLPERGSRREILKRFWDLCVCVCVFSCAIGVDSSSSCSCVQRFGLLLSSA
jgi:hypothetical protein